jgi:hypothetical protein
MYHVSRSGVASAGHYLVGPSPVKFAVLLVSNSCARASLQPPWRRPSGGAGGGGGAAAGGGAGEGPLCVSLNSTRRQHTATAHGASTPQQHTAPAHRNSTRRQHTSTAHGASTPQQHTAPAHLNSTRRQHTATAPTAPAHHNSTRRQHTATAHGASTPQQHTAPAHLSSAVLALCLWPLSAACYVMHTSCRCSMMACMSVGTCSTLCVSQGPATHSMVRQARSVLLRQRPGWLQVGPDCGEYGAKLAALLQELAKLQRQQPCAKAVIFSSWAR